ncbi:hypothetical protein GGR57DRAFT_502810 [Xylariaceae sp. FL1272]|nr:hypothetical protein GGR57DRAFT_502810 [Xylariaceae sp. FL1272]
MLTTRREAARKSFCTLPFGRNKQFIRIGRKAILENLLAAAAPYSDAHDYQQTVIEGLGGIGKTQTLKSKSSLARTLSSLGKYEDAEQMHRETLAEYRIVLGLQHPDTLQSMSKLGITLWSQGKYADAEQIHREALGLYRSSLGRGHPDTGKGVRNLVVTLESQRK